MTLAKPKPTAKIDLLIAGAALLALLLAQVLLSGAFRGTNYNGGDGKMVQGVILSAVQFGERFAVTNINPLQGIGAQMMPKNVWANPAFWPFALLGRQLATDVSALVALACFVTAVFLMARCFGLQTVPSAIAAQSCILLFAPVINLVVHAPGNFVLTPGDAVVYAPHMVALGLLARMESGSPREFLLTTAALFALLLYSLCCDPLWTMVSGIAWAVPFALVIIAPFKWKAILLRFAVLSACFAALFVTGALEYLYTISQYTSRVQFGDLNDRQRVPELISAVFRSPSMGVLYLICALGWILGILLLRGRERVLVVTAALSFSFYVMYCVAYVSVTSTWVPPLPIYIEHGLFALYLTAAVAGFWGALRAALPIATRFVASLRVSLLIVAIIPATAMATALRADRSAADRFREPLPNEPELAQFFVDKIGLAVGRQFGGSAVFPSPDYPTILTMTALWIRRVPIADEYSQIVTPQASYFVHAVLARDTPGLNWFIPWPSPWLGSSAKHLQETLAVLGVRYVAMTEPLSEKDGFKIPPIVKPRRSAYGDGNWYIHELSRPNVGDFSPTEIIAAASAAEIAAKIATPGFQFDKQAVLTQQISEPLLPAHNMKMSLLRGGWHVSGKSDGTSLIVLPLQFSNCLRAHDTRVRLVRANLMLTGLIFSRDVDTDILFDYGIFSPSCRRADLADMKRLGMELSPAGKATKTRSHGG